MIIRDGRGQLDRKRRAREKKERKKEKKKTDKRPLSEAVVWLPRQESRVPRLDELMRAGRTME